MERLVDECAMSSDSKKSSRVVAMYGSALRSCASNGFVTDHQVDFLMAELISNKVFSDARFLDLERAVDFCPNEFVQWK